MGNGLVEGTSLAQARRQVWRVHILMTYQRLLYLSVKARLQTDLFSRNPTFVNHLLQDILSDMDVNLIQSMHLVQSGRHQQTKHDS